ncbi:MAG: hypothetical protein KBG29_00495 [Pseudomonadales bacterium]|jgi:toxin CptA|nr:hypothetical protein [Pseudomonadales bacterium]
MDCPHLELRLAPSRGLLGALCALHFAGVAGLAGTALPAAVMVPLSVLVLASLARQWRAHAALAARGGTQLEFRGEAWWVHADGLEQQVQLRADSVVLPFMIVLRLQQAGRVRSLVVLADSLPRGQLRRLRVMLRLRGAG